MFVKRIATFLTEAETGFTSILLLILRTLQFVLALTVIGLYGGHLFDEHKDRQQYSVQWIYAIVVAMLSTATCVVYLLPFKSLLCCIWDAFLFIVWMGVFATFGKIYIHRPDTDPYQSTNTDRMKAAVWVDLTNAVLWFITASYWLMKFLYARKERTLHTGRAYI